MKLKNTDLQSFLIFIFLTSITFFSTSKINVLTISAFPILSNFRLFFLPSTFRTSFSPSIISERAFLTQPFFIHILWSFLRFIFSVRYFRMAFFRLNNILSHNILQRGQMVFNKGRNSHQKV